MNPSVIQIGSNYVHHFNEEHLIVTVTEDIHQAKVFYTIDELEEFIDEYADAGYGFNSDNYTLVEVEDVDQL